MRRCFQLALLGKKSVGSNPMVGAVLVHDDMIIGEGWHKKFGQAHAEVNCLQSVSEAHKTFIAESTLYVSLEPCIHFGKTPPCTDLILTSGIKKVVIGCADPFEKVNGGGIRKLEEAGVEVITPMLEDEARVLNRIFFNFHTNHRPYVILKWAQSADNRISSTGKRYKISNDLTDALVHKWRAEQGAILIGTNTALIDNPALTTRKWPGANPLRLLIDMELKTPASLTVFTDDESLVVFNAHKEGQEGTKRFVKTNSTKLLSDIMAYLYACNITSLIVEGGSKTLQTFIDAQLW